MSRVMKLVEPHTGRMECKVCGNEHFAMIKPMSGGRFYRSAWGCSHGCKLPGADAQAWNGWIGREVDAIEMHIPPAVKATV